MAIFIYLVINENVVRQQFHKTRTLGRSRGGGGNGEGGGRNLRKRDRALDRAETVKIFLLI